MRLRARPRHAPAGSTSPATSSCTCPSPHRLGASAARSRRLAALPGRPRRSSASRPTAPRPASTRLVASTIGGTVARRQRRGRPRRGPRRLRRRGRPGVPAAGGTGAGGARGEPPALEVADRRGLGGVDPGRELRRQRARRPALRRSTAARRVELGPAVREADGTARATTAPCPPKGARLRIPVVPHGRRRPPGNVARRAIVGAALLDPLRVGGGEPGAGRRAASTARPSRRPRSAARSCCAPATGR